MMPTIRILTLCLVAAIPFAGGAQQSSIRYLPEAKLARARTIALSNAKQLAIAAIMFTTDHDDNFPNARSTDGFRKAIQRYYKSPNLWKLGNPNGGGLQFATNLAGVSAVVIPRPSDSPLLYESKPWPDGRRIVAYADGHVRFEAAEDWAKIQERLKAKYKKSVKRSRG